VTEERASILVVDDNPLIVNVLTCLLTSEDYRVFTSANGKEAREMLEGKSIDVIICDVMMPEMDGYAFHDFVRSRGDYCHIPFVFLTGLSSDDEKTKGRETGADDYLVKPFDPRNLLSIVRGKVLRSRRLRNHSDERYENFRKRVIHTLSHEFRTPLVAINTGAELLLDQEAENISPRAQSLIAAIQRGGQRLERLVTDFMLLQQIEAGIARRLFESRAEVFDVADTVCSFAESRYKELRLQGFTLICHCLCKQAHVRVYEAQVHDIMERLLNNAVKFSKDDRGIGLDLDRVHEAIDLFGQLDRERFEQQGGGLGLAIASRYAEIQGGGLEFNGRKGGGSAVGLILPITEKER